MNYSQIQQTLKITAVILTITAIILIPLIALGTFDPKPVGELVEKRPLSPITIPAQQQQIIWLDNPLPTQNYSIRLTASFVEGEKDSLYGLILGNDDKNIAILLSPLGDTAIQQSAANHQLSTINYQLSWPHVRTGNEPNEIWVDVIDGQLTVRINRELLWSGEVDSLHEGFVGIMGKSWGGAAAPREGAGSVFDFQQLEVYQ